jgi:hypothetical protein
LPDRRRRLWAVRSCFRTSPSRVVEHNCSMHRHHCGTATSQQGTLKACETMLCERPTRIEDRMSLARRTTPGGADGHAQSDAIGHWQPERGGLRKLGSIQQPSLFMCCYSREYFLCTTVGLAAETVRNKWPHLRVACVTRSVRQFVRAPVAGRGRLPLYHTAAITVTAALGWHSTSV